MKNSQTEIGENLTIPVQTVTVVKDGEHSGVFSNVSSRKTILGNDTYTYITFEIELSNITKQDGKPVVLNVSAPANLTRAPDGSPSSKLAKILTGLKIPLKDSITVDGLQDFLVGKTVVFSTYSKTNLNGTFAEVLPETLRLE